VKVKITERGWAGHFICADRCQFRRNTLISYGNKRIVVSTVGMMKDLHDEGRKFDTIGAGGRYYETMAFKASLQGPYWDVDVSEQINFDSEWSICANSVKSLPFDSDNKANDMHDAVVRELSKKIKEKT